MRASRLPKVDDKVLREWFEKNHARYDQPATYNFQEAILSGDKSEAALHAFVAGLNSGSPPSDAQAGLRVFKDRPRDSLVQSVRRRVHRLARSIADGRVARAEEPHRACARSASTRSRRQCPAEFEKLRGVVLQDWTDATMAEQRSAAVRALEKKYTVKATGAVHQ